MYKWINYYHFVNRHKEVLLISQALTKLKLDETAFSLWKWEAPHNLLGAHLKCDTNLIIRDNTTMLIVWNSIWLKTGLCNHDDNIVHAPAGHPDPLCAKMADQNKSSLSLLRLEEGKIQWHLIKHCTSFAFTFIDKWTAEYIKILW